MLLRVKNFIIGCIIILFGSLTVSPAWGQSFDKGLELYRKGNFKKAVSVFNKVDTPEARLFIGKSYFSLGEYIKAQTYLADIGSEIPEDIYHETIYTMALTQFQLNNFGKALEHLHAITNQEIRSRVVNDAKRLYDDILHYLTLAQRKEAFQAVTHPDIRYDLIKSAFGKVDYETAGILFSEYKKTLVNADTVSTKVQELEEIISDSVTYEMKVTFGQQLRAPRGIVYNIGAALPKYNPSHVNFSTVQGLYYGYILAAEEFNQRNPNKKVFIKYKNTGVNTDSSAQIMSDFVWNFQVDAILGPLFSEAAKKMSELAELYRVPIMAPLANSDDLNSDNPYLYQANPTFSSHGKKMARYAVQELKMDTIAVLAEKNSLGATSAFEFREEAEKLGAKVPYFFVEDLESLGYEVGEYTKYFTTDKAEIDSMNYHQLDGVYAPFTGQAAPTLIDLLLIDLQGMNSDLTVLGSQEWGATEIPENRLNGQTIYFSETYYVNSKSDRLEQFKEEYTNRFGIEPNRFAMIGYDTATYLLNVLDEVENPALLKNALKNGPFYEGLISNIDFKGTHINQEVKIFQISDQGIYPAEY